MLPLTLRRPSWMRHRSEPMLSEFDRFWRHMWGDGGSEDTYEGVYPVDIREEDDEIVVDAELPGFKRDEIDVSLEEGVLRIRAERKVEDYEGTEHLHERRFTRVERAFSLPSAVDDAKVDAKLADGVLHLRLPKTGESKPKRIQVK